MGPGDAPPLPCPGALPTVSEEPLPYSGCCGAAAFAIMVL